ncbi:MULTISPECIES: RNA-directed DNA polymerase [Marinifilum]|uniref:RNA-directed DNA polymerase n=1 Tax=Marinifilum TaxID=866673 RepID=UPI0024953CD9|nr:MULTISPECIES: RNA-directed DNA polymerase [Marinifilum]
MKLTKESITWAINHIDKENDTDIFPKPPEIEIIKQNPKLIIDKLSNIDIGSYKWNLSRRLLIPKDELSHRVITQLDPLDSIFLSAIIKEYGQKIESSRIKEEDEVVFGNRLSPSNKGLLYKSNGQWAKFWEKNKEVIKDYKYAVRFDIADFYNQIYHHTIENILIQCDIPNQVKKSICNLLKTITFKVSRGVPVGPHSTHILAEAAMIPIDNSLKHHGIKYTRYMDDFVAFANSEVECRIILNKVAEILDKQERLILQRYKTKIFKRDTFLEECHEHLEFEPLNEVEEKILRIVKEHTDNSPYGKKIKWNDLSSDEKEFFSQIYFDKILEEYIALEDFSKLRWIYRRLKQLGVPQAIDYTLDNLDKLTPVINDVCEYFISSIQNYKGSLTDKGKQIHELLNNELIKSSEYFQISLINLFSKTTELNHFKIFTQNFGASSDNIKRKILLVAESINAADWIRELKEKYNELSVWSKRAFLIACSSLPKDERKFLYETADMFLSNEDLIEKTIIDWGKKQ